MTLSRAGLPTTPKRRVPLWDNARWVAITLVVVGHAILKLIHESDAAYETYLFIYAFHVAVFVCVSGYFAKSGPPGSRALRRLLTDLVFPYFIFETIWTIIHFLVNGKATLDYASASWTLWFLIALAVWRAALPYLVLLRYPLAISIIASIGAGYVSDIDGTFALSRTIGLLPFFVFGWKIRQWQVTARWLRLSPAVAWRWRAGAIAVFAALAVTIVLTIDGLRHIQIRQFLLYDTPYAEIGYDQPWAGAIRLGVMLLAFTLTTCFLLLMPRRRTWFTPLGAATLYIYLLHTFFLYPLREGGVLDGPKPWWVLPGMILVSVALSIVLSQPIVSRLARPLVEPRARWMFRKQAATMTGTLVLPEEDR